MLGARSEVPELFGEYASPAKQSGLHGPDRHSQHVRGRLEGQAFEIHEYDGRPKLSGRAWSASSMGGLSSADSNPSSDRTSAGSWDSGSGRLPSALPSGDGRNRCSPRRGTTSREGRVGLVAIRFAEHVMKVSWVASRAASRSRIMRRQIPKTRSSCAPMSSSKAETSPSRKRAISSTSSLARCVICPQLSPPGRPVSRQEVDGGELGPEPPVGQFRKAGQAEQPHPVGAHRETAMFVPACSVPDHTGSPLPSAGSARHSS